MDLTINAISSSIELLKLQTRLFNNVVIDISDEEAEIRLNGITNHFKWLTGHIVSSRFALCQIIGIDMNEPYPQFFENGKKGRNPWGQTFFRK